MNFKEIYKSANDSIHGDRSLIDAIYNKKGKKMVFTYKYPALCAAALLIILSVSFLPDYLNHKDDEVQLAVHNKQSIKTDKTKNSDSNENANDEPDIRDENMVAVADLQIEADEETNSDANIEAKLKAAQEEFSAIEDVVNDIAESSGYSLKPSHDNVVADDAFDAETVAPRESSEKNATTKMPSDNSSASSVGGASSGRTAVSGSGGSGGSASGGASVTSIFPVEPTQTDYMTIADYIDYLGIDIMSLKPALPAGMTVKFPPIVSVTKKPDGTITDDSVQFSASDENNPSKIITLSTTKLTGTASSVISSSSIPKIKINNYTAAVSYSDTANRAYFKYKDVWVSIASVEVTKEEFDTFLSTLLK